MRTTPTTARPMMAPDVLGLDTRAAFRTQAVALLESLPEGGRLAIDLRATHHVDSAGLGVLMLIQRRAAERGQIVALQHPQDELRFLLNITKLDELFEIE